MSQHACHHCGYDLTGSPAKGHCPECGAAFDKNAVYQAARSHEPAFVKHLKWGALAAFTLMVLICGGIVSTLTERPRGVIALTLFIAGVSGFGAFTYWWVERQERRALEKQG